MQCPLVKQNLSQQLITAKNSGEGERYRSQSTQWHLQHACQQQEKKKNGAHCIIRSRGRDFVGPVQYDFAGSVQSYCKPCADILKALCSHIAGPVRSCRRPCAIKLQAMRNRIAGHVQSQYRPCAAFMQALCSHHAGPVQS